MLCSMAWGRAALVGSRAESHVGACSAAGGTQSFLPSWETARSEPLSTPYLFSHCPRHPQCTGIFLNQ